jgi:hypothetical protein
MPKNGVRYKMAQGERSINKRSLQTSITCRLMKHYRYRCVTAVHAAEGVRCRAPILIYRCGIFFTQGPRPMAVGQVGNFGQHRPSVFRGLCHSIHKTCGKPMLHIVSIITVLPAQSMPRPLAVVVDSAGPPGQQRSLRFGKLTPARRANTHPDVRRCTAS